MCVFSVWFTPSSGVAGPQDTSQHRAILTNELQAGHTFPRQSMSLLLSILTHTQWCQPFYPFGKCDRLVVPSSSQHFILWPRDTPGASVTGGGPAASPPQLRGAGLGDHGFLAVGWTAGDVKIGESQLGDVSGGCVFFIPSSAVVAPAPESGDLAHHRHPP